MEGAAKSRLAMDPGSATHEGGEAFDDGKSKSHALLAPDIGFVGLGEGFEQGGNLIGRDADAGVAYGKMQKDAGFP